MSDTRLPSSLCKGATRAAWRRWEMHEVGAATPRPCDAGPPQVDHAAASPAPAKASGPDPDIADIERQRDQALAAARQAGHAQGYEAGLEAGRREGYQQGQAEGLQAGLAQAKREQDRRAAQLDLLMASAEKALASLDNQIAQAIVDLALRLAQQVIQSTLAVRPEALLDTVRELLQPHEGQPAWVTLRIHPDDHTLVAQYFASLPTPPTWRLITDDSIAPGGCMLETSLGQIDATLQTRWQRVAGSLGVPLPPWQEHVT